MTDLSPAAQAIKAAFDAEFGWSEALAAALRAAADQSHSQEITRADWVKQTWILKDDLLAITAELEANA